METNSLVIVNNIILKMRLLAFFKDKLRGVNIAETITLKKLCFLSDQLVHPDYLNFPIKPDQARLKGIYATPSRPLVDYRRSIIPTYMYMRALHDLNSINWTSARSLQDLHPTRSACDRILLE